MTVPTPEEIAEFYRLFTERCDRILAQLAELNA